MEEFSMPYKNPQSKKEWELKNRAQRLARRRELRQINAAPRHNAVPRQVKPKALRVKNRTATLLVPMVAGGALAAYSPKCAMGSGGLILLSAVIFKKGWEWWIVGTIILALGFFFYSTEQNAEKQPLESPN
jgi:hypothetical protein